MSAWKTWRGPQAKAKMEEVHRNAVKTACFTVLAASKTEVPWDEGTLGRSGKVFLAPPPEAAGVISYGGGPGTGGPLVPYAVDVHEQDRNYQHGRKRHYLKDPYDKYVEESLKKAIKEESRKEFGP